MMTSHYFENSFIRLHYYKFGSGSQAMLCFHGYGMHGRQFTVLENALGSRYTFYGFDLFFHKGTQLADESLPAVKAGFSKMQLAQLIHDFCLHENINRFSVIGYSMGSHYATAVTEELAMRINEYIIAAPSSINAGRLVSFFSKNRIGNRMLAKLMLSEKAVLKLLGLLNRLHIIDATARRILNQEFGTPELRYAFYACFTYLRYLETNEEKLIQVLKQYTVKSIFIFGKRDKMYLPAIARRFFAKYHPSVVLVLDENHEMINHDFAVALAQVL